MNIFQRLFGGKRNAPPPPASLHDLSDLPVQQIAPASPPASAPAPTTDPRQDPNLIRVYDSFGRELFVTRQQWHDDMLPGAIQTAWNKPDELYDVIVGSLKDGFRSAVVKAAEHLYRTDSVPSRGACLWGVVLMEEGRLDEAQRVFCDFLAARGDDGVILCNLAKVYSRRGDDTKAEQILWRALEVDPNQENGMGWYWCSQRERNGEPAGQEALARIAALPTSWRAQLWLAREALAKNQPQKAFAYYEQSLARAGRPAPWDLLMQMSGDLGNHGHFAKLLQFTEPCFNPATDGLPVGNNLIKAHVELDQIEEAQCLLETLYRQNRPDWRETLLFWETEIAKKRLATSPRPADSAMQVTMLSFEGPIWLRDDSPALALFRPAYTELPWICFLGSSAEIPSRDDSVRIQMSDTPGRISRALPLFLAEQTDLYTQARARTLIAWLAQPGSGFVLCGKPWPDDQAAHFARGQVSADYLVLTHLLAKGNPWTAQVRLIRTIDSSCLAEWQHAFTPEDPQEAFGCMVSSLHAGLREHVGVLPRPSASHYSIPEGAWFAQYLLRLEQLLATRCSTLEGTHADFLHAPREILDGNLSLCLQYPQSTSSRLLLAQTAAAMKKVRPDIIREYRDKLSQLQSEKPLREPAQAILQRIMSEVLTA